MDIYKVLEEIGIEYKRFDHPAVFTVEEAQKHNRGGGAHSKNLFLRNKKGDKHYLVILEASKRINLKKLAQSLNESDISFASPERLQKYLGLTPGAVSLFGLVNDSEKEVEVIVDTDLLEFETQGFHPNINISTLVFSTKDFKKFLSWTNNKITFLKL